MTTYHANASKLQQAMKKRRDELKLTQVALAEQGGMARITVNRWEHGEIPVDVKASTLDKVDAAYHWPRNHAASILGVYSEVEAAQEISDDVPEPQPSADSGIPLNQLASYVRAVSRVQQTLQEDLAGLSPQQQAALNEMAQEQIDIVLALTDRISRDQS